MKTVIKKRANGSTRLSYDFSDEKSITDQAHAKELTMASIVKKLEKGILPNLRDGLIYSSDLGLRNLQEVIERKEHVTDLFYQLPTEIRSLMGNDLNNFESVLSDPKNKEILTKHGLLVEKKDNHFELISAINSLKGVITEHNSPSDAQK